MIRSAGEDAILESSEAMVAALTAFAGVQSEPQIIAALETIMASLFGADRTALLSRNASLAPSHRIARLTGSASQTLHVTRPEIEERMQRGAIFSSELPAADLPGVPIAEGARMAVLVPCSSIAAMNAVCAAWDRPRRPFTQPELDQLRALATVAGLAFDRHLADAQTRILRANLENRVRNVLAVIRSVGTRSAERAPSLEQFLLHFEGRIDAIGRSQLAATRDGDISFELLLREELLAQTILEGEDVSLEGMDVSIPFEQAEGLALAIHELAVNAVKFGPCGGPGGSLAVRWWVEGAADRLALNIDWRERCASPISPARPAKAGFGLTYLERALPFQLNAETALEFGPRGLSCQITVPLPRRPGQRPRAGALAASAQGPAGAMEAASDDGRVILLDPRDAPGAKPGSGPGSGPVPGPRAAR
jgi:two-component sensor histidine kinase